MRFAVVGDSPSVEGILRAVVRDPDHDLKAFALAPRLHAALLPLAPAARLCLGWEELLSDRQLDAVIVAGHDDHTLNAARQLAATGKALLVGPTAGLAANFAYELTLLKAEREACLVPLFGLRAHPLVSRLRGALTAGKLGAIRHVQLERRLIPAESTGGGADGLSQIDLAAAFLPDADLLRSIWGEFGQVTAIRSEDPSGGISTETITLSVAGMSQASWIATMTPSEPFWRLNVAGQRGDAILTLSPNDRSSVLEILRGEADERETATFDADDWLLGELRAMTLTRPPRHLDASAVFGAGPSTPTWDDFTRAAEFLEAAERSIRRRRTIELHFETPSELGQFKTQMTAAGCSLLMFTLGAIVLYLTAAALVDMHVRVKQVLVGLIFLPLGIFLALQVLVVLARPATESGKENRPPRSGRSRQDPPELV